MSYIDLRSRSPGCSLFNGCLHLLIVLHAQQFGSKFHPPIPAKSRNSFLFELESSVCFSVVSLVYCLSVLHVHQEELSVEEKAKLFQQLLEQRRKHFAAKRAKEKRNKPPTQAQQRKIMYTYLKNIEGYKLKGLNSKGFDSIQEMFDRAFKRVTIDAISLAVKSPRIVDYKIHKEGKKSYYQILRADGKSQMYMIFSHMLKSFDREDLETLYKLVKAKYKSTTPVEDLDLVLWNDLKTMFEPHVEDAIWRNQQDYKVLSWKLYDSCRVHFLRMQHVQIYMLVEKRYLLTPPIITDILNKKLQVDYFSKMAYQLLKLLTKQLKNQWSVWKHPPGDYGSFNG
ncbi:hypothetical protein Tco_0215181 [Tanacetum coccineum]